MVDYLRIECGSGRSCDGSWWWPCADDAGEWQGWREATFRKYGVSMPFSESRRGFHVGSEKGSEGLGQAFVSFLAGGEEKRFSGALLLGGSVVRMLA